MTRKQLIGIGLVAVLTLILAAVIVKPLFGSGADEHEEDGSHSHGTEKKAPADAPKGAEKKGKAQDSHDSPALLHFTPAQEKAAGIKTEAATAALLKQTLSFPGEIRLNEDRTAHVVPRVNGVVEQVNVTLGERVRKGQLMAVIASTTVSEQRSELNAALRRMELAKSNADRERKLFEEKISAEQDFIQSKSALQEAEIAVANARQKLAAVGITASDKGGNRFELRAPFDGYVLEKHVVLGEAVREDTNVYTISDLSVVWANFSVTAADLRAVRDGATATVKAPSMDDESSGTVSYVGNLIGESTRSATARVTLPNPNGAWRSGLFVNVTIVAGERRAEVTVPTDAIQSLEGKTSVFVKKGDGYEAHVVQLGASDALRTEIKSGISAGDQVVTENSYILKAELEKGSAEHAH